MTRKEARKNDIELIKAKFGTKKIKDGKYVVVHPFTDSDIIAFNVTKKGEKVTIKPSKIIMRL
jgi:hypothetical protein